MSKLTGMSTTILSRKTVQLLLASLFGCFFLLFTQSLRAQEPVDGIAAVVEGEIILLSEVQEGAQMQALQLGINPYQNTQEFQRTMRQLEPQVLQTLIDQRIIQAKAEEDSIVVKEHEIEQSLEQQIEQMVSQAGGSEAALEEALGKTMREIRNEFREEIRRQLLVQRYQTQKFANISVTRKEIENFYKTYKDSIPEMQKRVNISHIVLKSQPDASADSAAVNKLREIQKFLESGAEFAELAQEYSQDPGSRQQGGDLGFVSRGSLVPEFEEVAFALEQDEVSNIVKTDFGYHLIKLEERRGEKIHVRHILISPQATEDDVQSVKSELSRLRNEALNGASFDSLAQEYSVDTDVDMNKGNLGWYEVPNLDLPEFQRVVETMEVGDISEPFQTDLGWHIIKLNDMRPAGKITLEDNWSEIEQMVIQQKRARQYQRFLETLRSQFYVDVKVNIDLSAPDNRLDAL